MSYRSILVPILHDAADSAALAVVAALLDIGDVHVTGLHARTAPGAMLSGRSRAFVSADVLDKLEAAGRERAAAARELFETWRSGCGLAFRSSPGPGAASTAEWREVVGEVSAEIGRFGRASDLVVLARSSRRYSEDTDEALHGALFDTGRPVLIVPGKPAHEPLGTAIIAWNDSREAALAVSAAWPVLERAKRVVIYSGGEDEGLQASVRLLADHLAWRRCTSVSTIIAPSGGTGTDLLAAAHREGAGMIVMGAYSHSRLQQFVFGGVTSEIFSLSDIPVLTAR